MHVLFLIRSMTWRNNAKAKSNHLQFCLISLLLLLAPISLLSLCSWLMTFFSLLLFPPATVSALLVSVSALLLLVAPNFLLSFCSWLLSFPYSSSLPACNCLCSSSPAVWPNNQCKWVSPPSLHLSTWSLHSPFQYDVTIQRKLPKCKLQVTLCSFCLLCVVW